MRQNGDTWSRTVFRVRGIPYDVKTFKDTALLLCPGMGDVPIDDIQVYSLATALLPWENPRSKVATVMFRTLPSLTHNSDGKDQWRIPVEGRHDVDSLTLDTHFKGMTPLNDVDSIHLFDCIAISGLASHPFGSWQPKGGDKRFMWIRDALPKHIQGVRAVIYGYDTKLDCSPSFQRIPDLAQALISQLQTYGWDSRSGKPVAFLAHSLGGLVLREAMVQLNSSLDDGYKGVLSLLRGAVFFGVPNLGMEQSHFRIVVHDNPNGLLVDDIARGSNYLRQLNRSFKETSLHSQLKCFWAWETSESPTIMKRPDGTIDRNGMPTILVSKDSATCGTPIPSMTFPINETHSDMVKFTKDSEYYHIVVSRLNIIFGPQPPDTHNTNHNPTSIHQSTLDIEKASDALAVKASPISTSKKYQNKYKNSLKAELDAFKRATGLTDAEESDFKATSFASLQDFIRNLQAEQEQTKSMRYMKRLEPFLNLMKEYVEIVEATELFVDVSDAISYLWGPMKYILHFAQEFWEAFDLVLDAYQKLGLQLLAYLSFEQLFISTPHMRDVLVMMYKDILCFHRDAIPHFKQRHWKRFFEASWKVFAPAIDHIERNLEHYRRLVTSRVSITEFEAIQNHRQTTTNTFEKQMKDHNALRQDTVKAWLRHFDCKGQQESYRDTRSICRDPGRWLLNHPLIQDWFNPDFCPEPLLWLNGIPGAGKTILASVIIDEAQRVQSSMVAFFYCKHDGESRNSFLAVARSILAQILSQNPRLLPYFDEKACISGDTVLSSAEIANEMLQTTLNSCGRTYLIIDGLDECAPKERKNIISCFSAITEIRCLFISQDDGFTGKTLRDLPTIRITTENKEDLKEFAAVYHKKLEARFGELPSNYHIANIISARAQGMFIFAEVLAKYLEIQLTRSALLEELHPDKLPIKLDEVYERILNRICQLRSGNISDQVRLVLGWIVCAKRPLRWREIQGALSINLDQQHIDYDKKLLASPKELFGSLVELDSDGTVQLIHATAREYLIRTNFVQPLEIDYSLSMLSLAYLAFPQVDKEVSDDNIATDLISGIHAFYDYASACWAIHLETGIPKPDSGYKLIPLLETLEAFIPLHLASTSKTLAISKKVQTHLSPMKASEHYDEIAQAVEWSRKQLGPNCQRPSQDEALDLWQVTDKIRSVLEEMHRRRVSRSLPEADAQKLDQFYGSNWFKCPRVSCHYYHQGFSSASQRKYHVDRHDRPFLCVFDGCQVKLFGCPTEDELRKHVFDWHGIDVSDDRELAKFPKPPKLQKPSTAKNPATFQCHICPKKYTANHNLKSHIRTHAGIKGFMCSVCGHSFTRRSDCNRHEQVHGDKKFICLGDLKDGSTWGCTSAFWRADKLADHFRSKTGQNCIRPLILQNLQDNGEGASAKNMLSDELGTNADALLAAGKLLPSFGEFLRLCGIDKSVLTSEATESSPSSENQSSEQNY
ncbi:hypothetical protein B0O99DRAFT_644911 [Bisporella sp. PMI_857]|nr:hypothetical protein B0O99DRAFT_644911 [Bisporella sp. PMI_857]